MKGLLTALAVVVALAMAAPAGAAANVDLSGSLDTVFQMVPTEPAGVGVSATSDLQLELSLDLNGGQQVRAFVGFEPIDYAPFFSDTPYFADEAEDVDPAPGQMDESNLTPALMNLMSQFRIDKAYLETTGPFLNGGQDMVTRFGDLAIDYSPYIAHISETDGVIEGVQVSGLSLGPVQLAGFYGWATRAGDEGDQRFTDRGVLAKANIEGINVEAAAVKTGEHVSLAGSVQFAPIQGIDLTGTAAWDGAHEASALKAEAGIGSLPGLPGVSAKVGYRDFDPQFDPIYRDDRKDEDDNDINVVDINAGKRGVNGEVATTVAGLSLVGTADWHEQSDRDRNVVGTRATVGATAATEYAGFDIEAGVETTWSSVDAAYEILDRTVDPDPAKETTLTLGLGYGFPIGPVVVDTEYDLTMSTVDPTEHEIAATTRFDTAMLSGIELAGNVNWTAGECTYLGQASYTAPNGIEFIASYNNGYTDDRSEGFALTAGMKVDF